MLLFLNNSLGILSYVLIDLVYFFEPKLRVLFKDILLNRSLVFLDLVFLIIFCSNFLLLILFNKALKYSLVTLLDLVVILSENCLSKINHDIRDSDLVSKVDALKILKTSLKMNLSTHLENVLSFFILEHITGWVNFVKLSKTFLKMNLILNILRTQLDL